MAFKSSGAVLVLKKLKYTRAIAKSGVTRTRVTVINAPGAQLLPSRWSNSAKSCCNTPATRCCLLLSVPIVLVFCLVKIHTIMVQR
ncbi:hypothetical protein D3C71_1804520 [compost metagenome]